MCSCGCTSHTPLGQDVRHKSQNIRLVRQLIATEMSHRLDIAHGCKGPTRTAVPLVLDTEGWVYNRNNRAQVEPRFFIPQCRLQSAAPRKHVRTSGSEGWHSDCLSLMQCCWMCSIAAQSYGEPPPHQTLWEDRLPLTCSLRSPELFEVELHSSQARSLHCCGHRRRKTPVSASTPSQPAVKCAKEPMCLRTGVPLR